jgi:DNA-binding transcriptional MerR regulator
VRKIPQVIEEKMLRLWLEGHSYRTISKETGCSVGTVHNKIEDFRRQSADLDALRLLNISLKEKGSNVYDILRGARLLDALNKLGVDLPKIEEFIKLCEALSEERGVESSLLVDAGVRLVTLQQKTGFTYDKLADEYEAKMKGLRDLQTKRNELSKEIEAMQKTRDVSEVAEELVKIGVKPEKVKKLLAERGALEKELQTLEGKIGEEEIRLRRLTADVNLLQRVQRITKKQNGSFYCPHCQGVTAHRVRRFDLEKALRTGYLPIQCMWCGALNQYDIWPFVTELALEALS